MDFALTDEQELIRSTARQFADEVIRPAADDNARNSHFDTDLGEGSVFWSNEIGVEDSRFVAAAREGDIRTAGAGGWEISAINIGR